jgi:hypothetical protein
MSGSNISSQSIIHGAPGAGAEVSRAAHAALEQAVLTLQRATLDRHNDFEQHMKAMQENISSLTHNQSRQADLLQKAVAHIGTTAAPLTQVNIAAMIASAVQAALSAQVAQQSFPGAPSVQPPAQSSPPVPPQAGVQPHLAALNIDAAQQAQIDAVLLLAQDPNADVVLNAHIAPRTPSSADQSLSSNGPFAMMSGGLATLAPVGDEKPSFENFTRAILTATRTDHKPFKTIDELTSAMNKFRTAVLDSAQSADNKVAASSYAQEVIGFANSTNVTQATAYHKDVLLARAEGSFQITRHHFTHWPAVLKHITGWTYEKKLSELTAKANARAASSGSRATGSYHKRPLQATLRGQSAASSEQGTAAPYCEHHPNAATHSTADCRSARNKKPKG